MELRGSTILITGASRGLGAVAARELHRRGASLVVSARGESALRSLAEELDAEVLVADMADRSGVRAVAERARSCDGVVLNAGVGGDPRLDDLGEVEIDQVIDINLRAPMVIAADYARHRIDAGHQGAIAIVGSVAGIVASPSSRLYNATKFGIRGFALSFAEELHGTSVSCSLVAPGFIRDTGMFHDGGVELPAGVRTKSPEDVAAAIVKALTVAPPEVFAAPPEMRVIAKFGSVAPGLSGRIQRLLGVSERQDRAERIGS
jgi:short-subunit dehydrogenase